jgi:hypothetical protein
MNIFLLAIFLSQMHFLMAPIPNDPTYLLQQYAMEITKHGNGILEELKKSESTMNLRTLCNYLESDAEYIINECKKEQNAQACREW